VLCLPHISVLSPLLEVKKVSTVALVEARILLTKNKKYNILYIGDFNMDAITYTDLRQNLKTYMDKVFQDHDPLIITRKNNENVVLLSVSEYNSLLETNYLLSNEANGEHLKKSIAQHKAGKTKSRELYEYE
jgi:antitoxin YefM